MVHKKIFVDMDGTITNSKVRMAELFNLHYRKIGDPIIVGEKINTWDAGMPPQFIDSIFGHEDFFNHKLEVFKGVYKAFEMLNKRGYEIILYSKGTLKNIANKSTFTDRHFGDIIDGHIFTSCKGAYTGKSEYDMSVKDGFSILIDDHADNLLPNRYTRIENMPDYCICAKLCGDDEEWNKDFTDERFILRDWSKLEDIINLIEDIEQVN
jgi:hypothetical protein